MFCPRSCPLPQVRRSPPHSLTAAHVLRPDVSPPTPRYKIDRATDLQQLSRDCELDSNRTGGNMGDEAPKAIAAPIADRRASAHLGALAQVVGPEPEGRKESFGFGKDTPPAMG